MRISTNTIFEKGTARMGEMQTGLAKSQQQVSTGRRLTSPSDDPVASARAMEVENAKEINAKYATNRRSAQDTLWAASGALQSVTSLLHDVKSLIVQAGNGTFDSTQRQYIATELKGRFEELLGLANTRDGVGDYIFAGFQSATKPFAESTTGATYSGDQGQRQLQVHASRQIDIAQHGNGVFEKIGSTGTFASSADTTNTGTGVISAGTIVDSTLLTGHNYEIVFTGGAAFNVYDLTTDPGMTTPLPSSGAYTSGNPIVIDGIRVSITGAPAAGDNFSIRATSNQSVFTTIKDLIAVLEVPAATLTEKGNLAYGLSIANSNIDSALDHVLTVTASVGSGLKEIESLDSLGEDLNLQYAKTLSELQDLDYVQAVTDLTKQQVALQAAQQSFMKVTSLSLFSYMS